MSLPGAPTSPRVLFLDHVGVLGGAELNLVDMVRHTRYRSHVILLADGPLRPALEAVGGTVTVLGAPAQVSMIRRSSGLLRLLRTIPHVLSLAWKISRHAKQFDVVWANSQKSFVIGAFAAALSRRPLVWHMHDILTADHFSPANRKVAVTLANRFAERVVTVSKSGLQSFLDSGGRPGLGVVVYNGIDPSGFAKTTGDDVREEIDQMFLPAGRNPTTDKKVKLPVVGVFGRLTPWKGQDVLIRALPMLPGVRALFVGEALFNEDAYAASLRALVEQLGLSDRVHFTGFRSDVARIMSGVDVVAHTSKSPEPFGRVIVEAMLANKPVIATAGGGAAEIISHGHDGVLVPPGNPALLASAISDMLANPEKASQLASQGTKTATSEFSLDAFLKGIERIMAEAARCGSATTAFDPIVDLPCEGASTSKALAS